MPQLAMTITACLLVLAASFTRSRSHDTRTDDDNPAPDESATQARQLSSRRTGHSLCGPLCIVALMIAAGCLCFSAKQRTDSWTHKTTVKSPPSTSGTNIRQNSRRAAATANDSAIASNAALDQHSFRQDSFSIGIQWLALIVGTLFTVMALTEQRRSATAAEHFGLLLFVLVGVMLIAVANDLIVLFLALELIGISAYSIIYLSNATSIASISANGEVRPRDAATTFILLNFFSSAILLFGFTLLYGLTGTTNLDSIRDVLISANTPSDPNRFIAEGSRLGLAALVFIFAAIGVKCAAAPFHCCLVDATDAVRPTAAGLIIITSQIAGFVVLIRVLLQSMIGYEEWGQVVTLVFAIGSMAVGNLMALVEIRIHRMLAFLAVSQTGFLLAVLTVGLVNPGQTRSLQSMPDGIQSAGFFLLAYCLAITGLFAVLAYLTRTDRQMDFVEDLSGLVYTEPLPGFIAVLLLLSLAGLPPLPGFWGRLFIITATMHVPLEAAAHGSDMPDLNFYLLLTVALLNIVLTAVVTIRLISVVTLDNQRCRPQPSGGPGALLAAVIAGLAVLLLGLLPGPLLEFLEGVDHLDQPHSQLIRDE